MPTPKTDEKCIHHWRVNDGGTRGVCKFCGAVQTYGGKVSHSEYKAAMRKIHEEIRLARRGPLR
jgi:hypothetical protein